MIEKYIEENNLQHLDITKIYFIIIFWLQVT